MVEEKYTYCNMSYRDHPYSRHMMCCGWCTLEVVLSLFNVLNEHFDSLVKHMVNQSILTNRAAVTVTGQ